MISKLKPFRAKCLWMIFSLFKHFEDATANILCIYDIPRKYFEIAKPKNSMLLVEINHCIFIIHYKVQTGYNFSCGQICRFEKSMKIIFLRPNQKSCPFIHLNDPSLNQFLMNHKTWNDKKSWLMWQKLRL